MSLFRTTILALALAGGLANVAQAEGPLERAVLNSTRLVEYLHTVEAKHVQMTVANIESGKYRRVAPELPVWIVEILSGTIVYYQGEAKFKGQAAAQLVDDKGVRFGEKALNYGRGSRSGWLRLTLDGKGYQAFCKTQYPFVACTVALGS